MSSRGSQKYTRPFATRTDCPVFSVDYRLAPDHPFPAAVEDCWQAYYWIVCHAESQLGIKTSKYILTGDSAGGNLVITVTIMAIEKGFSVPDLLVPAYPGALPFKYLKCLKLRDVCFLCSNAPLPEHFRPLSAARS